MRSWWRRSLTRPSLRRQREVDVLERRPPHLEALELARRARALRGQLVQHRVGSSVSTTTSSPFAPVADLGRDAPRRSAPRGVPTRDDLAVAQHGDAVGELLGLVEVVRRQQDRLAERRERADHLPGGAARGGSKPVVGSSRKRSSGSPTSASAEVEPALLAAGERLHARVALLLEPDELDHLVRRRAAARSSRRTARVRLRRRSGSGRAPTDWRTTPIRSRHAAPAVLRVDAEHA